MAGVLAAMCERESIRMSGFFGLIVLVADLWAMVHTFQSHASTAAKVVWAAVIIVLPVLGFVAWLLAGPRANR